MHPSSFSVLLTTSLLIFILGMPLQIQSEEPAKKENLDLPYNSFGLAEEEEAPEIVVFMGKFLSARVFFIVWIVPALLVMADCRSRYARLFGTWQISRKMSGLLLYFLIRGYRNSRSLGGQ